MNTTLTRRNILAGIAATGFLASAATVTAPQAAANSHARPTILVSPHPDDETLRGAGYVNWAISRGDTLVLLALTDGGATGMGRREGLTPAQVMERRRAEQVGAWSALTGGTGTIVRAGIPDGAITADAATTAINQLLATYPGAEVYVAARPSDDTKDHREACAGAAASNAKVVRYMRAPADAGGGTAIYSPPNPQACHDAVASYWWTLGPRSSVGSIRNAMLAHGYRTRVTR